MTYKQRMRWHLEELAKVDQRIEELKQEVKTEEIRQAQGRNLRVPQPLLEVRVNKALGSNPWFQDLAGSRDHHVARATMYGIAALVSKE